ncbi:DNA-binding protein, excisionase family [Brevibacillus sp. CF112]|uniref:helix-turn-helix domain-containing protein n=1 Tax=Brevibacillus sp. CF112 TaxID=1144311 RepID=UPI0002718820|nr:helix-turn-helix domain-containing protein [Brevibacillus sp. CF112]EJL42517.1 DNA-binding protein, excisionase family [Brevibacillus sp. CF112]
MNEKFYTVEEIAEYLKLTPATVRKFCVEGELGHYKIGKQFRIPVSDFEKFMRSKYHGITA